MDELNKLRKNIDLLDKQIMNNLNERFLVVEKIKKIKQQQQLAIQDKGREQAILQKSLQFSYSQELNKIYQLIFTLSKNIQGK